MKKEKPEEAKEEDLIKDRLYKGEKILALYGHGKHTFYATNRRVIKHEMKRGKEVIKDIDYPNLSSIMLEDKKIGGKLFLILGSLLFVIGIFVGGINGITGAVIGKGIEETISIGVGAIILGILLLLIGISSRKKETMYCLKTGKLKEFGVLKNPNSQKTKDFVRAIRSNLKVKI